MTFDSHHHLLVSHLMQLNARVANLFGISQSTCEPPPHLMMMWGSSAALLYIITVGTDLELMNLAGGEIIAFTNDTVSHQLLNYNNTAATNIHNTAKKY